VSEESISCVLFQVFDSHTCAMIDIMVDSSISSLAAYYDDNRPRILVGMPGVIEVYSGDDHRHLATLDADNGLHMMIHVYDYPDDGRPRVIAAGGGVILIFDGTSFDRLARILMGTISISSITGYVHHTGRYRLVTGHPKGMIQTYDPDTGEVLCTVEAHAGLVSQIVIVPTEGGHIIISGSHDGVVRLSDGEAVRELGSFVGHPRRINSMAIYQPGERWRKDHRLHSHRGSQDPN
jgi:WD40 repeat protein